MNNKLIRFTAVLSLLLIVGCKEKTKYQDIEKGNEIANAEIVHKIVVKDFIEAGTYDYLKVEEEGKEYWMAIPDSPVELGKTYYYKAAMVMKDFVSEQLNRTFDEIIFSEGIFESIVLLNNAQSAAMGGHMGHGEVNDKPEIKEVSLPKIKNAVTIEELFANPKSFANKTILVYGVAVKVNNDIMDKNWVHIVDGTKFNNKSDLTITTLENVKVGDTLTFNGILILDKDFGHGYKYDVLLEDGKLVK